MDIQYLRYFVEVVRQKNFTRAANQLFITQPMLTKVIKRLEQSVGAKLIERTSKSFRLTDVGETFFAQAQDLISRYDDLFREIDDVKSSRTGTVNLSIPGTVLDLYFASLLTEFRYVCPDVDINILEQGSKRVIGDIRDGTHDIGLVMLPIQQLNMFDYKVVVEDRGCIMVNRTHPFAGRESVHFSELRDERIITFSDTAIFHDELIKRCEEFGFVPNIVYKTMMPSFIVQLIKAGQFVAVLPRPIVMHSKTDDLVAVPLIPQMDWKIGIIRRKDGYHSFAAKRLFEYMVTYFNRISR